jgi:hypothetical protein
VLSEILDIIVNNTEKARWSYPYKALDRPWESQKVEVPRISTQSARESGKLASPTHRPPLLPGYISGTHFI